MWYIPARLRIHACMQCIRAPPTLIFVDLNAGYNYIWQAQNGDPTRVCRYSKTPDKYGDTQASAWSRALATAWSRACCAIAIMASNT